MSTNCGQLSALSLIGLACTCIGAATATAQPGTDLMQQYPTSLTAGDANGMNARTWRISEKDIYHLRAFALELPEGLRINIEEADLGIGHSRDGAVWAAVIPRAKGTVTSHCAAQPETITSLWLRFHPSRLGALFPAETVQGPGNPLLLPRMRELAFGRMNTSWQGGRRAMIPGIKEMTVLPETTEGELRFFMVDGEAGTAKYVDSFNYPWRDVEEDAKPHAEAPPVPEKRPLPAAPTPAH